MALLGDSRAKELIQQGDYLYGKRMPLLSLWQEIADNFYSERADFTISRYMGQDFAANLTTSYPVLARRELGDLISSMTRPAGQDWYEMSIYRDDKLDDEGRAWLEWAGRLMRRAMYDKSAQFIRASKESDQDFVTFGQAVTSTRLNRNRDGLLYRTWHLRDVAWCENDEGAVDTAHRKWKPTAITLDKLFKGKVDQRVKDKLAKDPYTEINCRHIVIPSDIYDTGSGDGKNGRWTKPFISIYVDTDHDFILEELPVNYFEYSIPRWQTVSGSQYAYSPCTVAALPDARLIQAMSLVLLEAGEKAVNPPMIGQEGIVRSDVNLFAGAVTWLNPDYDERFGEGLRPVPADYSGLPIGMEMRTDIKESIMHAFYLNKINLPPPQGDKMTATEVQMRMQEYVRGALPLFEPMETEKNSSVCGNTFQALLDGGGFGSVYDMPKSLRGQDVQFVFESPLYEAADRQKGHTFMEAKAMLSEAVALDPTCAAMVDAKTALRDVLDGIGVPAKWMKSDAQMKDAAEAIAEQQKTQQLLATMAAGGAAAEQTGKAVQAFQGVDAASQQGM